MTDATKRVCLACGKVKGEHHGWDVSCEINSTDIPESMLIRGEEGRVIAIEPDPLEADAIRAREIQGRTSSKPVDFDALLRELDNERRWRLRACRVLTLGRHWYRQSWRVDLGPVGFDESDETLCGCLRQCRICGDCEVLPRA